mmetsp:Transcript_4775/g.10073  ORF Transcript_4775/g.10073 Transcript_4775/m.10073 type:complete len:211 (-) Transcript_4775:1496-2128(-)
MFEMSKLLLVFLVIGFPRGCLPHQLGPLDDTTVEGIPHTHFYFEGFRRVEHVRPHQTAGLELPLFDGVEHEARAPISWKRGLDFFSSLLLISRLVKILQFHHGHEVFVVNLCALPVFCVEGRRVLLHTPLPEHFLQVLNVYVPLALVVYAIERQAEVNLVHLGHGGGRRDELPPVDHATRFFLRANAHGVEYVRHLGQAEVPEPARIGFR